MLINKFNDLYLYHTMKARAEKSIDFDSSNEEYNINNNNYISFVLKLNFYYFNLVVNVSFCKMVHNLIFFKKY